MLLPPLTRAKRAGAQARRCTGTSIDTGDFFRGPLITWSLHTSRSIRIKHLCMNYIHSTYRSKVSAGHPCPIFESLSMMLYSFASSKFEFVSSHIATQLLGQNINTQQTQATAAGCARRGSDDETHLRPRFSPRSFFSVSSPFSLFLAPASLFTILFDATKKKQILPTTPKSTCEHY